MEMILNQRKIHQDQNFAKSAYSLVVTNDENTELRTLILRQDGLGWYSLENDKICAEGFVHVLWHFEGACYLLQMGSQLDDLLGNGILLEEASH